MHTAKAIISWLPDVDSIIDLDNTTPLHCAVEGTCTSSLLLLLKISFSGTKKLPIIKFLLDSGAAIEPLDYKEYTPLFIACESGNAEIVDLLLDYCGSIAGGFTFNMESGWSIAAFKLANEICTFFQKEEKHELLTKGFFNFFYSKVNSLSLRPPFFFFSLSHSLALNSLILISPV